MPKDFNPSALGYLATNMKEQGDSKYKRLIDTFFMEVKRVFRPYSVKFSKRTYTQHQLAVAILLMKYERKTYRDIANLLKELLMYFGLDGSTPHFTTLEKFFMRIPTYIRDFLLAKTYELFEGDIAKVSIDSTGYGPHHASQHYEKRTGRRKRYMKHFISIYTGNQAIVVSGDWRSYVMILQDSYLYSVRPLTEERYTMLLQIKDLTQKKTAGLHIR